MEKTAIRLIREAAAKLRDSKLKRLGGKETGEILDGVVAVLGLGGREEAIVFTALFDRSCAGRCSDLDDLASYFGCPQLEMMEYVPQLKSLLEKGLIIQTDMSECRIGRKNFMATNYVIDCILENKRPEYRKARILEKEFDRYDLCNLVDSQIQDREISAESLFQFLESTEREYGTMPLVKDLTAVIPQLPARALFYEICHDYFEGGGDDASDIDRTLKDIYEAYGVRFREKKSILDGSHPLISKGLVEVTGNREGMQLTVAGQKLFLGEDFGAFGRDYSGLDIYSFAREVKEYLHSREYNADNTNALNKLAEKIKLMEEANRKLKCLSKIRGIIKQEDIRALFYIACDDCADSSCTVLTKELRKLYPPKERNASLKAFKDGTHKLQKLDLAEVSTESSLFGEYTVLKLTPKARELYFGEDAELFSEETDRKNIIRAADIKEKKLFFSAREKEQLSMVGNTLQESNYASLVERLGEKGLAKGIAILLYGAPGTGKTESVMQWARQTGRDIVHVDISAAKSMWYGESEKIVKEIFSGYRRLCKNSGKKPILLFNEADAIFSKRRDIEGGRSVDQTENTIQNIILEEMEKLEGILIATTNLADNLDKAFERRFLFKIRFDKPSAEAKKNIWLDKLPSISAADAEYLASGYDFSGGEIDNIVRKVTMMEVIDGRTPSMEEICRLCGEEKLGKPRAKIGFA